MSDDAPRPAPANIDRERLDLALQAAGLGEFEWDVAGDLLIVSERMAALAGLPAGRLPAEGGDLAYRSIHPDDRERTREAVSRAVRAHGRYDVEYRRIRPDNGREIWMRASGVLVRDAKGQPERLIGVLQDITARKRDDAQRDTLMAELDHRVKNVLAAVQSLAGQTARRTTSLDAFLEAFGGRLKAMASANELLTAARWRGAAIAHLTAAELGGVAPERTRWSGPELFLSPRAANALSLALHELATNAMKFGSLSTPGGRVDVRWSSRADEGFELVWSESGGPPVRPPTQKGFGSTLLNQVTGRELNGEVTIDWRAPGVRVTLAAGPEAVVERPAVTPLGPGRSVNGGAAASGCHERPSLAGLRVLIVEDAVLLAMELESSLTESGAKVIGPAYELDEALGLLDQPIDAAVLDANLNGRSVQPVAERLAARGVPFVFATGYGETQGAPAGFDAPVVRKPYDVGQVVLALAEVIART